MKEYTIKKDENTKEEEKQEEAEDNLTPLERLHDIMAEYEEFIEDPDINEDNNLYDQKDEFGFKVKLHPFYLQHTEDKISFTIAVSLSGKNEIRFTILEPMGEIFEGHFDPNVILKHYNINKDTDEFVELMNGCNCYMFDILHKDPLLQIIFERLQMELTPIERISVEYQNDSSLKPNQYLFYKLFTWE